MMTQVLSLVRLDGHWAVRDVTGSIYGLTTEISEAKETAEALARRIGGRVTFSEEARSVWDAGPAEPKVPEILWRKRRFVTLVGRFRRLSKK